MKIKTSVTAISVSALLISAGIDLTNLDNYALQSKPAYINKDNTGANPINDKAATLGRVLFYDKKLSAANTIACASCHQQQFAFGDTARLSTGVTGGLTERHAMRLVNARFAAETKFFWDERAATLEFQTTQPIRNHTEMGYSGQNGDQNFNALISKLSQISYYNTLFSFAYGDAAITEDRIQKALAQFIRSIQSFDSKFDAGLSQAGNINAPFANFTALENQGKGLFLTPPSQGGAGCHGCHRAPEFDIVPNSKNNGVIASAGGGPIDITNTRAPSLRDIFNSSGVINSKLMHNGNFSTIEQVINHYNKIPFTPGNTNLDPRLTGPGGDLQLTQTEKNALAAFIKTLSGANVYNDPKWSDPFDSYGNLNGTITGITTNQVPEFKLYPNPVHGQLQINIQEGDYSLRIVSLSGFELLTVDITSSQSLDLSSFTAGLYFVEITDRKNGAHSIKKIVRD
ncbi:MAG: cytochrome c peroxidase [Bacteroidota bacterium]